VRRRRDDLSSKLTSRRSSSSAMASETAGCLARSNLAAPENEPVSYCGDEYLHRSQAIGHSSKEWMLSLGAALRDPQGLNNLICKYRHWPHAPGKAQTADGVRSIGAEATVDVGAVCF
jgi:hypothetical protein